MEEIQNKAIATYQKNLEFLSNYDRKLYDRLQGLSTIIDMGEYVPRYHIEYISEDESFDIFDEVSNSYLYQKKASKFDKTAASNTNKDKINSFDLFNPEFYNIPHKMKLDGNMSDKLQYAIKVSNDISEYTKIFKYSTKDPKKQFKRIDKFVFMGTLLGTHIPKIHKKLQSDCYFITDANLEIFRLSLFATDYSEIAQKSKLIFSIMDDKSVFLNKFDSYLNYSMKSNYMVKYYSTNFNMQDYFDRVLEAIFLKSPFKFSYVKYMDQVLTCSLTNMKKYPAVLNAKSHNFLENKPVLCLAAGPTFGKNIDWIKKNHKRYFLVAIGATVKKLIENDIFPDLITSADPGEHTVDHFPKKILDKIKDIPFLTSHMTHNDVLNCFNKKNIYLYEAMTSIKETSRLIEGASIGEATLDLLLSFGANQIYLLGSDLALDQETGRTHEADYEYGKQLDVNLSEVKENQFMEDGKVDIKDTIIKVKGNFRKSVSTTAVFARSILAYNAIVFKFLSKNPSIKIYNLNDGAHIEGTITEKIDNIDIPKEDSRLDAKEFLDKNSSIRFPLNDIERMKKSIPFVSEIIKIINKIEAHKSKTYDAFLDQRTELIGFIINNAKNFKGLNISEIFGLYISTVEPYLGYNFNDTKKIDEANLVKKVKKVWCRQVKSLANKYISILNSTVFASIKYEKVEIKSNTNYELGIKRDTELTYHIAYNETTSAQGVLFIVPEYKDGVDIEYQKDILISTAEEYNVIAVFVEYQNSLLLQAIDIINVLCNISLNNQFEKVIDEKPLIILGNSNGGYIANLVVKFAPNLFTVLVDNSSCIKPEVDSILEKGSSGIDEIMNLLNENHIEKYKTNTEYIAYHSVNDKVAPFKQKKEFYEKLSKQKIKANLFAISDFSEVDSIFIKSLEHGMGISIKALIDKSVPKILFFLNTSDRIKLLKDSEVLYETLDGEYSFKFKDFSFYPTFKLLNQGE